MDLEQLELNHDTSFDQEMTEESEFLQLDAELSQLMETTLALENFGVNPTAIALMQTTGLLNGTSLDAIATESFLFDKPSGVETQMAIEALSDKIKDTAARWSAKILSVSKKFSTSLITILTPLYTKVAELTKKVAGKGWEQIKSAGKSVAAHPVKTILIVLGAITAVAALMAYCGSSFPGGSTTRDALAGFFGHVNEQINKIPWPFGKVKSTVSEVHNLKIDRVFAPKAAAQSVQSLGWTASTVKSLGGEVDKAWDATKRGIGALGMRMLKVTSDVGHATFGKAQQLKKAAPRAVYNMTGSSEAAHATAFAVGGIYYGACISLVFAIYRLVKKVIIGGFRLIFSTLDNLLHL